MDEIWAAFALAVVTLELESGSAVLRPDEVGQVGSFPFDNAVHIVTAYNPGGSIDSTVSADVLEQRNQSRHQQLETMLLDHECLDSVGSAIDGGFAEPGFAILNIDLEVAIEIGAKFGQKAIYQWSDDRLLIAGVDEPAQLELGWSLNRRGIVIPPLTS